MKTQLKNLKTVTLTLGLAGSAVAAPPLAGAGGSELAEYTLSAAERKIDGAVRTARATDGGGLTRPDGRYNVSVAFDHELSADEVAEYEAAGLAFRRLPSGRIAGAAGIYAAWATPAALDALGADPAVASVEPGRSRVVTPPLEISRLEVQADLRHATRTWSHLEGNRGQGVTIGVVDTGIDIFHPDFFALKSIAPYDWIDVNGDGVFTPGVDAVDLNRNGAANAGERLNFVERIADAGASFNVYDCDSDWLYNDANQNGDRDFGPADGFDESDDCYGERLFLVADSNGDDRLSPGEKLHPLGKSKVRKVLFGDHEYVRGVDLINTPIDQNGHGTSVCSVLAAQAAGFGRRFAGIAPEAELVVVDRYSFDADTAADQQANYVQMLLWMEDQNAEVMLWEMGGWTSKFMDGSSHLEALISNRQLIGYSAQVIPNGNLGGKGRHAQIDIVPGTLATRTFEIPNSPTVVWASILTHANSGSANFLVEMRKGTGGYVLLNPGSTTTIAGHQVTSSYSVSSRGTFRFDLWIKKTDDSVIPNDDWSIRVRNTGADMETFHYFVTDNNSTWGGGAAWTSPSDASTVTWPATADVCIGVASYSTVGGDYSGDVAGVLSPFSGRGPRIDGAFVEAVAAPGDYGDVWCAQSQAINSAGAWGGVRGFGGTSAAGPHVAAAAALLFEAIPVAGAMDVRDALFSGARQDSFTGAVPNDAWGHGKLGADDAYYELAAARCQTIPAAANVGAPANGAGNVDPDQALVLNWTDDPTAQLYDLHFGTTNPPARFVPGLLNSQMTIVASQLAPNTTYYWQVVSRNSCGYVVKSDVWTLTTGAAYTPEPDIEVYQQTVVNNQYVKVHVPHGGSFAYPAVPVGETDGDIFAIYNEGDASLALSGSPKVQLSGPNAGDFFVNYTPTEPAIAPGGWAPTAIRFTPQSEGFKQVTVSVQTNDPDESPYIFTITALAVPGQDDEPADDDGDGVPNDQDQCPGQDDTLDSDLDGTPDCLDACPDDPAKIDPGTCGCGVADSDADADGIADCNDDQIGDGDPNTPVDGGDPNTPGDGGNDPNTPSDGDDPNSPADGNDPNTPGDGGNDPNTPSDGDDPNSPIGPGNGGGQADPNDGGPITPADPNAPADGFEDDPRLDIEPTPVGMCGFGVGLASLMCSLALGGRRMLPRRR